MNTTESVMPETVANNNQNSSSSFTKELPLSARMVAPETSAKSQALNDKYELMRSRNWITDRMVEQTQHHLHCSREEALEKLIGSAG